VEEARKRDGATPSDDVQLDRGCEMTTRLGNQLRRLLHTARVGYHWKIRRSSTVPYLPFGVSIEVTNRCNFKCAFCPQSLPDHFDKVAASSLTPDRAEILLRKIRDSGITTTVIHWTLDGEPFMNKAFDQIIDIISAAMRCS